MRYKTQRVKHETDGEREREIIIHSLKDMRPAAVPTRAKGVQGQWWRWMRWDGKGWDGKGWDAMDGMGMFTSWTVRDGRARTTES